MSSGSRDERSGGSSPELKPLDLGSPDLSSLELERPRGSSSDRQIAVALYRRPPYSGDPESRKWLQHETYHWGILIISPHHYDAYDATDRNDLDPVTMRYENPGGHWWFRHQEDIDPRKSGKCLGHIVIGSIPSDIDVRAMLEEVPLPERNRNPQQSCVTWVGNAIRLCRGRKYVDDFDVDMFLDWAMRFGDRMVTCDPGDIESQVAFYDRRTEEAEA
ncbi:hypothetical protein ACQKWADRAFT_284361 [Trichoderma austrokoningii]